MLAACVTLMDTPAVFLTCSIIIYAGYVIFKSQEDPHEVRFNRGTRLDDLTSSFVGHNSNRVYVEAGHGSDESLENLASRRRMEMSV